MSFLNRFHIIGGAQLRITEESESSEALCASFTDAGLGDSHLVFLSFKWPEVKSSSGQHWSKGHKRVQEI